MPHWEFEYTDEPETMRLPDDQYDAMCCVVVYAALLYVKVAGIRPPM